MNDKFEETTHQLIKELSDNGLKFILTQYEKGTIDKDYNMTSLVNLLMSAYISSLLTNLHVICDHDEQSKEKIMEFESELLRFISSNSKIKKVIISKGDNI